MFKAAWAESGVPDSAQAVEVFGRGFGGTPFSKRGSPNTAIQNFMPGRLSEAVLPPSTGRAWPVM